MKKLIDVTQEYIDTATPDDGRILYERYLWLPG